MSGIRTGIELNDQFTSVIYGIINSVNMVVSSMEDMQQTMDESVDPSGIQSMRDYLNQAAASVIALEAQFKDLEAPIREDTREQERFNREIQEGADYAGNLRGMIAGAVGAYAGMAGIRKAFSFVQDCTDAFNTQLNAETQLISVLSNMLDEDYVSQFELETSADTTGALNDIAAIQSSVDDVVVTVSADTGALTAAFNTITEKASEIQSRGIYGDEAMIAAAAEFSTYFTDTDAITMMMDTLADYAMGMSGGGAIDSTAMVNYATNLGKIMSGSYDAMTKKGFEFSEVQKAIIEGEATREQIVAALGEEYLDMSADMQAAAAITQVIDESWAGLYDSMSGTPEGKIIQLTNAWGDMKEVVGGQLYPYVLLFVDAVTENWPTIERIVFAITAGLEYMLGFLSWSEEAAIAFAQVIMDNWGWISPIIYGIIAALAVYYGWQLAVNAINLISTGIHAAMAAAQMMHAAATGALTAATAAEIAAQNGLNSALYACPIVWIIVLIIALIALFYAAVAAVNKFAGSSVSATGVIAGLFAMLGAHVINTFVVPLWNKFAAFANFFGNVMNDPIAAIKVLFYDLCLTVIGYILNMASAIENLINKIPGMEIDITGGLDNFYSQLEQAQQTVKDESGWIEYVGKMDYVDYNAAWDAGYSFGEGIEESIANFDPSSLFGTVDIPGAEEYASSYSGLSGISSGVEDIAGNTGSIADAMDITEEDLKYLRDIAEQEAVNRYTVAEVNVDMSGMQNTVKNGADLDGFVSELTEAVNEAVDNITEGVHE